MWRWASKAREGIPAPGGGCRQGPEHPESLTEQGSVSPAPQAELTPHATLEVSPYLPNPQLPAQVRLPGSFWDKVT